MKLRILNFLLIVVFSVCTFTLQSTEVRAEHGNEDDVVEMVIRKVAKATNAIEDGEPRRAKRILYRLLDRLERGNGGYEDNMCAGVNSYGRYAAGGGCNSYGCWARDGGCNSYGCWEKRGGCNSYGCWEKSGGCNSYGCWQKGGECNSYGCVREGGVSSRPNVCED